MFADIEEHLDEHALPTDEFAFSLGMEDRAKAAVVVSDRGTLTLTTSTSSRVAGTFSVDASGLAYMRSESEPQDGTVHVEGSFNALGGELPGQN